ncbi:hypothetical protein [Dactylosporangium sp. CA-233914]|uniref:hypothetical protein n=1 Tax=Dactylosporangium sp. CA-233914 TaxID=3239934 RepID=UPI003D92F7E2
MSNVITFRNAHTDLTFPVEVFPGQTMSDVLTANGLLPPGCGFYVDDRYGEWSEDAPAIGLAGMVVALAPEEGLRINPPDRPRSRPAAPRRPEPVNAYVADGPASAVVTFRNALTDSTQTIEVVNGQSVRDAVTSSGFIAAGNDFSVRDRDGVVVDHEPAVYYSGLMLSVGLPGDGVAGGGAGIVVRIFVERLPSPFTWACPEYDCSHEETGDRIRPFLHEWCPQHPARRLIRSAGRP